MARTKRISPITWVLMGFVLLGLGGFGVTNFAGMQSPVLAEVGDVEVSADDFARGLSAEIAAISAQTGQPVPMAQAQSMGVPQGVQARLITAAALEAQARALGLSAGDATVAAQITAAPGFAGPDGQFSRARYADILKREGLTEAAFEDDMRMDEARLMLQRAVVQGVAAPQAQVDRTAAWLTETRDLRWRELTAAELPEPVAMPDDAALEAWHAANADRFTAPETRSLTYVWLTPEMLVDEVQLDEAALRAAYDERADEFRKPARRLVERLVYPDAASAAAAKARLDADEVDFEQLAAERGLSLADIDLGEVTEADLGTAAGPVFAATENGIIGPVDSAVGPALFSVNAILDPVNVPFEEARDSLREEAALDRARRLLEERTADLADRLAGGATLEDLATDGGMELGTMEWRGDSPATAGSIAAYPAFREKAASITEKDFPELLGLDDGGAFALRLDKLTPPTLIPFAQARPAVVADWTGAETIRRLEALAEEERLAGNTAAGTPAPGLTRDSRIDTVPFDLVTTAFTLDRGESAVVEADSRVFLVTVDAIHKADPAADDAQALSAAVGRGLADGLSQDLFSDYAAALQQLHGLRLYPEVAAAVLSQMP